MAENRRKWYEKAGEKSQVIVSTRVRLARNLRRLPFPERASTQQREQVIKEVHDALANGNSVLSTALNQGEYKFISAGDLGPFQGLALCERHIISPEFVSDARGRALLVSEDESVSVMLNEEDHIRIQVLHEGLALKEAAETADRIDSVLAESLDFAYDSELGYLTQCPTNLGTGMRASLMLHLPGLTEAGSLPRIAGNLSKLGLTLRGAYGEGSRALGELYQLSNQITLGISENEAIENLLALAGELIKEEQKLRERLLENAKAKDKIARAAGTLTYAQLISGGEAAELLSLVRLGVAGGMLEGLDLGEIDGLMVKTQPGSIIDQAGKELNEAERDAVRAEKLRAAAVKLSAK